jgi:predicted aldo/keto reductase-like oxidoreductase
MTESNMDRRDFFRKAALAGGGAAAAAAVTQAATGGSTAHAQQQTVPRKKLGSTGVDIPIILMGGSMTFDTKYDKRLHRAFQLGVDYVDTAQIYAAGQSQKTLAPFLKQVGRDKVWVTSKVKLVGGKMTPENYERGLDSNLEDLETDYLDLFFMHMIESTDNLGLDYIKMGERIKKSGKSKFFGFSCHHGNVPELMNKAAEVGSAGIDAIMFRYNFRQYGDVELNKAIDACKAAGIGLIAMKSQGSVPEDLESVVKFQSENFTLGQAKLKSVWADERIDSSVSHMENVEHLMENTSAAMSQTQLSMNEFMQLNRLAALTAAHHCLGCNHRCESKIDGRLRISDTLRYLMYHESYGHAAEARDLYRALEHTERDFDGIDLAAAMEACPQGINISEKLAHAKRVLSA